MADVDTIMVAVRCRPFNAREKELECTLIVAMPEGGKDDKSGLGIGRHVIMTDARGEKKTYEFDRAYWSHDKEELGGGKTFVTQDLLFEDLGMVMLDTFFDGLNVTMFAYGQTGAGKSFSVLGVPDVPDLRGLLPRLLERLFPLIEQRKGEGKLAECQIYNEEIRDLLNPKLGTPGYEEPKLDVKQHPQMGVFVPGLTEVPATSSEQCQTQLDLGTDNRTVGATAMNAVSSRSHCIFTVEMRQTLPDTRVLISKINLVDLAGSERQKKTGATADRLKEGAAINKSLTNLAMVIAALAGGKKKAANAPFRNSKLTFLLKTALSGNSRTIMMAAISPANDNFDETTGTTTPVANVAGKAAANDMAAELEKLKEEMMAQAQAQGGGGGVGSLAGTVTYTRGQDIIKQGDVGSTMYIILKGGVAIYVGENKVATKGENQLFGEAGGLGLNFHRNASVRADEDETVCLTFGRHAVRQSFIAVSELRYDRIDLENLKKHEELRRTSYEKQLWAQKEKMAAHESQWKEIMEGTQPFITQLHEDAALNGTLVYALPKEERVYIGSGSHCHLKVQGYKSEPVLCSILNYDDDRVYLSRVRLDGEKKLAEEERILNRMVEKQQGIDGSPENFDTLLGELRGPCLDTRIVLDSHEMRGNEPHAFNLAENHILVNDHFYFRLTVPSLAEADEGGAPKSPDDEPEDDRAIMAALEGGGGGNPNYTSFEHQKKLRREDELFFLKTEMYTKGFSSVGRADPRSLDRILQDLVELQGRLFTKSSMVYSMAISLKDLAEARKGISREQVTQVACDFLQAFQSVDLAQTLMARQKVKVELPQYAFVPVIVDPSYGIMEGYHQEDNVPLMVGIMPIVDEGQPSALWGLKEFRDRIANLRDMVEQGVVATSKEYDVFAIVDHGFGESKEEDKGFL